MIIANSIPFLVKTGGSEHDGIIILMLGYKKTLSLSLKRISLLMIATVIATAQLSHTVSAHPKYLLFPVVGQARFSNDFTSPRSDGQHNATDIMANKGQYIVAAVSGTITYVPYNQPTWGYMITIKDDDGFKYDYIHINNDTPGTDDGNGGPMNAYAADMKTGNRVEKGQLLGYVGDSGNAETTASHLHFEITAPDGSMINPYPYLLEAERAAGPVLYPALSNESLPYGNAINTTVQIAAGDLDADSQLEYVTVPGKGAGSHIRMFNQDNSEVNGGGFFAYDPSFAGGANVATGDVDGDGKDEIITGTGKDNSSHVKIFEANGTEIGSFFAYPGYNTGVNVTSGDIDNDGKDEIITGTGPGNTTHIKVFKLNGTLIRDFFAYEQYPVGADVASGDINNDGRDEIVTSAGPTGGSHIKIFKYDGTQQSEFFAYPGFYGGVRLDVGNVRTSTAAEEIITSPYSGGGPDIRMFNQSGTMIGQTMPYESFWSGSYDVAAADGYAKTATGGNRRASVRAASF